MKHTKLAINKAVFPVAGLGTRFLPATKTNPKEMLTVVNKPLIQYAVEEAYSAGIRQMVFVTSHNKRAIEDHYDTSYELENELFIHHKTELLDLIHEVKPADMECFYVRQPHPSGLGDAVLCAESLIGDEPFAVILADDLLTSTVSVLKQMVEIYETQKCSVVAVEKIDIKRVSNYGIIDGEQISNRLFSISDVIEKPQMYNAPSNIAIVGRYILSPKIFDEIRKLSYSVGKEIQLTDAIKNLLGKERMLAYCFDGTRYDCGNILGFLMANVRLGMQHPTEGKKFSDWLYDSLNNNNG